MRPDEDVPDHHDADIIIRLYDLRRETVMRASRRAINAEYWPATPQDATAPMKADHPLNAAWRQTVGYWEMVFGMAHHGIVHADYLVENSGEGLFFYVRVEPWVAELRAAGSPRTLSNTEWAAQETEMGRRMMESLRARFGPKAAARA